MSRKKKILSVGGVFILGVLAGSVLMYNDSFYRTINDALGKGVTQNAIIASNAGGIESINLSTMDIETALTMVQQQRTQQLDAQLNSQITSVQEKNKQIASLNTVLNTANGISADSTDNTISNEQSEAIKKTMEEAGLSAMAPTNKAELDTLQQQVKGQIDSLSNSQQMEMLRLQSLTNKRNEAFDVMTNFIKKMQDSRSSIIGNMR